MTSTAAQRATLRLTRDQLSVVAHRDAEIIKQLERLVALAQATTSASVGSTQAADDSLAAPVLLSSPVTPGLYRMHLLVMASTGAGGDIRITPAHTATFVDTNMAVQAIAPDPISAYWYPQLMSSTTDMALDSSNTSYRLTVDAMVRVTSAGVLRFSVENVGGAGAVLLPGSFLHVQRVSS